MSSLNYGRFSCCDWLVFGGMVDFSYLIFVHLMLSLPLEVNVIFIMAQFVTCQFIIADRIVLCIENILFDSCIQYAYLYASTLIFV